MNQRENLEQYAFDRGIDIANHAAAGELGLVGRYKGTPFIMLDMARLDTDSEFAVVLSHELGHIETASLNSDSTVDTKNEHRADKWAVNQLVPLDRLQAAVKSCQGQLWEIAEELGVTEDFVCKALKHYGLAK